MLLNEAIPKICFLLDQLDHPIVVADLGSSGSNQYQHLYPDWLKKYMVTLSIDALETPKLETESLYKQEIVIKNTVISSREGEVEFIQRQFGMCSGVNEVYNFEVTKYGLENFYKEVQRIKMPSTNLKKILNEHQLSKIHSLKIDLEGSDLEVLDSVKDAIETCAILQLELRNKPLYKTEMPLGKSLSMVDDLGFELLEIKQEFWKKNTPYRDLTNRGNLAYCDAIFTKNNLTSINSVELIACLLLLHFNGYSNHAEYHVVLNQKHIDHSILISLRTIFFANNKLYKNPNFLHLANHL